MSLFAVTLFGFVIPLWLVFIALIIGVVILWKIIKFALKILLVIVAFFVILFGLDLLGVFDFIQNIFSSIV
jgi:hypothetical protein